MAWSHVMGSLFVLVGALALASRRVSEVEYKGGGDAVLLLSGISAMLIGGLLFLTAGLRQTVET